MISIGVDPGVSGAIAVWSTSRGLLERARLPSIDDSRRGEKARRKVCAIRLRTMVRGWANKHAFSADHIVVVIERMQSHGTNDKVPARSLLSMGYSAGIIEGVLSQWAQQIHQPLPRQWKPHFGLASKKDESVAAVRNRLGITVGHDVAEAILLAIYGATDIVANATAPPAIANDRPDPFASTREAATV